MLHIRIFTPRRWNLLIPFLAGIGATASAYAHERYNDGCQDCHGSFTDGTSPKGTIFPLNNKHEMHRGAAYMATNCGLCHRAGDGRNPFLNLSDGTANSPGVGCVGCHGQNFGGSLGNLGAGLRAHHAANGVTYCSDCHSDPAPLPETARPVFYGSPDTRCDDPCNLPPGLRENWTIGDTLGLDNDGDNLYDSADPDLRWYRDADGDGFGNVAEIAYLCSPQAGYAHVAGDCNDNNPAVHPGAAEICDGLDNNCDGLLPQDEVDADHDGFSPCAGDCNDQNPSIHPGATEICNGLDDNCDGQLGALEVDHDGDGVTICDGDCDDADPSVFPGAPELCDGIDNNCDGRIDEIIPTWFRDADGDNYGTAGDTIQDCQRPLGYVGNDDDCDDTDPSVHPGAPELCDGRDNDCDGQIDEDRRTWYRDADGDGFGDSAQTTADCLQPAGYVQDGNDCDDADATFHPGAAELCDGKDNDCDGALGPEEADQDGDGVRNCDDRCPGSNDRADADADGTADACDNCPSIANTDQGDSDADSIGDACDNCPRVSNAAQRDRDGDGIGDACDNCREAANADQRDSDGDSIGDVCDNCPVAANYNQIDVDRDGVGDACDNCRNTRNPAQIDGDNDGIGDDCDNCPAAQNPEQADSDGDGIGDACEAAPSDSGQQSSEEPPPVEAPASSGPVGLLALCGLGANQAIWLSVAGLILLRNGGKLRKR